MKLKLFLQIIGTILVALGILGFSGIYGSAWGSGDTANWTELSLGIAALFISIILP